MTLYHHLSQRWRPDALALSSGTQRVTFGELHQRVRRAAGWLVSRGLRPGQVLALQLPRSPAFLELHLAALATGVVTLPMHPGYQAAEVAYLLQDSGAALHLCSSAVELRQELDTAPPLDLPPPPLPDAMALLCYTSGTTGRPKGACLSHANLTATVEALHEAWSWSASDVLLHALPLFHIHGLVVAQYGALRAGASTVWLPRFNALQALQAMERHGATVFMGVPTFYHRLLALGPGVSVDLSSMRLFTSGSAPLPAGVHQAFKARFGHAILERYGMTEVGIVLSNPYRGERRPGSVGLPLPRVELRLEDPETGRQVAPGHVGELFIRGPSVFQGYLGRAEQTAGALRDGWMQTGDLGRLSHDGYVQLVGRRGDLILSGGFNVYPLEVEAALREHAKVADVAVVGLRDPDLGERVVAAVVTREGERLEAETLHRFAAQRLAPYKRPREIRLLTL